MSSTDSAQPRLTVGTRVDFMANAEHHVGEVVALPKPEDGTQSFQVRDNASGEEFRLSAEEIWT